MGFIIGVALNDYAKDTKDWAIDAYYGCTAQRADVESATTSGNFDLAETSLRFIIEHCSRPTSAIAATELAELFCWRFVTSDNPKRDYQLLLRQARDGTGVPLFDVLWTMEICKARGWLDIEKNDSY
jgi:hypothetical protein